MIRALIFDLDGTLVDSLPGIANALNLALEELKLPTHPETEVVNFIGNGAAKLAERSLSSDKKHLAAPLLASFLEHYRDTWRTGTPLYPGVAELIQSLKARGFPLAVVSNKMHASTVEIIAELFPSSTFDPVFGQREGFPKKPDPTVVLEIAKTWNLPPDEVAYVGDSMVDLATARNAGMLPLIFSWGYGTPADVPLLQNTGDLEAALTNIEHLSSPPV